MYTTEKDGTSGSVWIHNTFYLLGSELSLQPHAIYASWVCCNSEIPAGHSHYFYSLPYNDKVCGGRSQAQCWKGRTCQNGRRGWPHRTWQPVTTGHCSGMHSHSKCPGMSLAPTPWSLWSTQTCITIGVVKIWLRRPLWETAEILSKPKSSLWELCLSFLK